MVTVVPWGKCRRRSACNRWAISAYITRPSVSVYNSREQLRDHLRTHPKNPVELARCYCCIAPVCSRIADVSLPTRGYCSLNIVVMRLATGVSAVTHVEGISG